MIRRNLLFCILFSATLPLTLVAQEGTSAASKSYFLAAQQQSSGDLAQSSKHVLVGSFGDGVVAGRTTSSKYTLHGGFVAMLDTKTQGQPWLTSVSPRFATPLGGATVTLSGTELNLGGNPKVTIGGQTASVLSKSHPQLTAKLPVQPVPGWQPVTVSSTFGTTTVAKGIGILPMLMTAPAPSPNSAFDIVFKGTQGDQVVWAMGIAPAAPQAISIFRYGLAINPVVLLVLPGFTILPASGEFRFPIPPSNYTGNIYVQALFATSNPGYAPGSFSNLLKF